MAFVSKVGSLLKQSGGKHVSMGLSSSNSLFFQAIRSMSSAKLFVGGLSYATDEVGLREAFQQYGEVIDAKVIIDRDSGRSRGFGFVSYTSADAANTALQDMDGKDLHGRRLRVNFAQERPRPSFGGGGGYGGAGGYSGGGYGGAGGYTGGGGGSGGYSGGGYAGNGGYGDGSNNLGGYGGRNQSSGGADDPFGRGVGGGSGVSPGGGIGDDLGGNLNHDLSGNNGRDDFGDDGYANTSNNISIYTERGYGSMGGGGVVAGRWMTWPVFSARTPPHMEGAWKMRWWIFAKLLHCKTMDRGNRLRKIDEHRPLTKSSQAGAGDYRCLG